MSDAATIVIAEAASTGSVQIGIAGAQVERGEGRTTPATLCVAGGPYHQVEVCEKETFNLRRLYIWLMGLNIVMLICPIIRHFMWEKHMKAKAA